MIAEHIIQSDQDWIIFDPELIAQPQAAHFQAEQWGDAIVGAAEGRQAAYFIDHGQDSWVLRHYWRGGLPGALLRDQYVYLGRDWSRPFKEWRILARAHADGVHVPRPVAARVSRSGLVYRGDILMQRIEHARSLADLLADNLMLPPLWRSLALTIARCHQAGYWHADLNARNVLCRDGQWWIIDFDRARQRGPGHWGFENIRRLKRSLDKLQFRGQLRYRQADWNDFVEAWHHGLVGSN